MMNQADSIVPESMATARPPGVRHLGDRVFKWLTLLMALSVFALIVLVGFELPTRQELLGPVVLQRFPAHYPPRQPQ